MPRSLALAFAVVVAAGSPSAAQWTPTGLLGGVPLSDDCARSAGAPAYAAEGPQIFTCASAVDAIESEINRASAFFLVHEYGHIANEGGTESQADCWAATELGANPDGVLYIDAAARWLEARGEEFAERSGTASERAARIRACSGLQFAPPPAGESCCTSAGSCALSDDGPSMPLGTWCYCVIGGEAGSTVGAVCAAGEAGDSL